MESFLCKYLLGAAHSPMAKVVSSLSLPILSKVLHIVRIELQDVASAKTGNAAAGEWREHLFSKCLPYIARAFHEDIDSMPEQSRAEHYHHLVGGDVVYVGVLQQVSQLDMTATAREVDGHSSSEVQAVPSLAVSGHCLIQLFRSPANSEISIVHARGMCVDPAVQGGGVGGRLLESAMTAAVLGQLVKAGDLHAGLPVTRVFFSARTQNDAILKLFVGGANAAMSAYAATSAAGGGPSVARVFPCAIGGDMGAEASVAEDLAKMVYSGEAYDAGRGVYTACYPQFLHAVFGGDPSFAVKQRSIAGHCMLREHMNTASGDAALLVVRLR